MVKGVNRRVIVMKPSDGKVFEQAIFLLREDALEKMGIGEKELLEEAKRIAGHCSDERQTQKRMVSPAIWAIIGALPIAAAWILTLIF